MSQWHSSCAQDAQSSREHEDAIRGIGTVREVLTLYELPYKFLKAEQAMSSVSVCRIIFPESISHDFSATMAMTHRK